MKTMMCLVIPVFAVGYYAGFLLWFPLGRWFFAAVGDFLTVTSLDEDRILQWRLAFGTAVLFASVPLGVVIGGRSTHRVLWFAAYFTIGFLVSGVVAAFCQHELAAFADSRRFETFGPLLTVPQLPSRVVPLAGAAVVIIVAALQRWFSTRMSHATPLDIRANA